MTIFFLTEKYKAGRPATSVVVGLAVKVVPGAPLLGKTASERWRISTHRMRHINCGGKDEVPKLSEIKVSKP